MGGGRVEKTMPTVTKPSRGPPRPGRAGSGAASGHNDGFAQIAAMIAFLERLPDLSDDIEGRRSHRRDAHITDAFQRENDNPLRADGVLDPLTRRAFEAVVAGFDRLAESAADLCGQADKPLTPGEREACAEIGKSMRQLLERAMALVESPGALKSGARRAGAASSGRKLRENKY
jgi:hypothetical protein